MPTHPAGHGHQHQHRDAHGPNTAVSTALADGAPSPTGVPCGYLPVRGIVCAPAVHYNGIRHRQTMLGLLTLAPTLLALVVLTRLFIRRCIDHSGEDRRASLGAHQAVDHGAPRPASVARGAAGPSIAPPTQHKRCCGGVCGGCTTPGLDGDRPPCPSTTHSRPSCPSWRMRTMSLGGLPGLAAEAPVSGPTPAAASSVDPITTIYRWNGQRF